MTTTTVKPLTEYTEQEIRELPAGRELDALVATFIVGDSKPEREATRKDTALTVDNVRMFDDNRKSWYAVVEEPDPNAPPVWVCKAYSTSIADVWPLWEKVRKLPEASPNLWWQPDDGTHTNYNKMGRNLWHVATRHVHPYSNQSASAFAAGATAPLAICRCLLLAKRFEQMKESE